MFTPFLMIAALFASDPTVNESQEALVQASITDLKRHDPSLATAFRNVRLTIDEDEDGAKRNLVCGEFRPAAPRRGVEWEAFGSRDTMSGREHLVGAMAKIWCENPDLVWDPEQDLSARFSTEVTGAR